MSSQVSSAPRQGLNPRQADTVERLLAAAGDELSAGGAEALTIRTVAGRAGVSAATAYTYFASKNHLFAELFLRHVLEDPGPAPAGADPVHRLQAVTRHLAAVLTESPHLAKAANLALLGTDPDVERLRLRIGAEFVRRFREAIGEGADPRVVDTITLAFTGALLQAGMDLIPYDELGPRLDDVIAVIMSGQP